MKICPFNRRFRQKSILEVHVKIYKIMAVLAFATLLNLTLCPIPCPNPTRDYLTPVLNLDSCCQIINF